MRFINTYFHGIKFVAIFFYIIPLFFMMQLTCIFPVGEATAQQNSIVLFAITENNEEVLFNEWEHILPGKQKAYTNYSVGENNNEYFLKARSGGAGSLLEKKVESIDISKFPIMEWSWMVSQLPDVEWEEKSSQDDFAIRIELIFDYKGSKYNPFNIFRKGFITTFFRGDMPEAILSYVWANGVPVNRSYINPTNKRMIIIPVESGPGMQDIWIEEERNIKNDFDELVGKNRLAIKKIRIRCDTENSLTSAESALKKILLKKN